MLVSTRQQIRFELEGKKIGSAEMFSLLAIGDIQRLLESCVENIFVPHIYLFYLLEHFTHLKELYYICITLKQPFSEMFGNITLSVKFQIKKKKKVIRVINK